MTSAHNPVSEGIRHTGVWRKGVLGRENSSGKKALRRDMMPSESKQRYVDSAVERSSTRKARV